MLLSLELSKPIHQVTQESAHPNMATDTGLVPGHFDESKDRDLFAIQLNRVMVSVNLVFLQAECVDRLLRHHLDEIAALGSPLPAETSLV
jgi:hypothetical protein